MVDVSYEDYQDLVRKLSLANERVRDLQERVSGRDAHIAALEAQLAERVRVKPLVWVPTRLWNRNDYHGSEPIVIEYVSEGPFAYTLSANYQIGNSWDARLGKGSPIKNGRCVSFGEAKAAAQADFERRILSALEAAPAPKVTEAMVEAAAASLRPDLFTPLDPADLQSDDYALTCRKNAKIDVMSKARAALKAAMEAKQCTSAK